MEINPKKKKKGQSRLVEANTKRLGELTGLSYQKNFQDPETTGRHQGDRFREKATVGEKRTRSGTEPKKKNPPTQCVLTFISAHF